MRVMTNKLRQFFGKINIGARPSFDEPLSGHTTMRIGGPADAWIAPGNRSEFLRLLEAARAEGIPVFVIGGGANLLVGDRGIRGIVASTENLRSVSVRGKRFTAEAGLSVDEVCLETLARGLKGFGNFAGMPGSLGGAILMNARCYDTEIADLSPEVLAAGPDGRLFVHPFDPAEWSYKRSPFQDREPLAGSLILGASFELDSGDPARTACIMRERRTDRERKGHYRLPSAGSVFKNDRLIGAPSGAVLDSLGFRGKRIGDAAVSDWHANIFVNAGVARASDMRLLIRLAQDEVREKLGFTLEPEIIMAGDF